MDLDAGCSQLPVVGEALEDEFDIGALPLGDVAGVEDAGVRLKLLSRMLKPAVLRLVVSRMLVRRAMRKATIVRLQAVRHHRRLTFLLVTRGVPSLMLGMLVLLGWRLSLGCLSSLRNTLPNIGQCIADGKRDVLTRVASARSSGVVKANVHVVW